MRTDVRRLNSGDRAIWRKREEEEEEEEEVVSSADSAHPHK